MASARRIGAPGSKTRAVLLDAAERLMLREGYAAVTSRRVAGEAGLKPQLVHYYFRTMDDLFLELFRRRAEQNLERFQRELQAHRSLRTLWDVSRDPTGAAFTIEFVALANHRKEIRAEIAAFAERFRKMQLDTLESLLSERGLVTEASQPMVALLLMTGLSQVLALEDALGISGGHEEALDYVHRWIERVEPGQLAEEPPGAEGSSGITSRPDDPVP